LGNWRVCFYLTVLPLRSHQLTRRVVYHKMRMREGAHELFSNNCLWKTLLAGKKFRKRGNKDGAVRAFINLKLRGWAISRKLVRAKGQQWYVWTADIPKLNHCMYPVSFILFVRVAVWLDHLYYFRYYLTRDFVGLYVEWIAVLFKCCGFHRFSHNPSDKLCSANMEHSHKVPTASRFQHTLCCAISVKLHPQEVLSVMGGWVVSWKLICTIGSSSSA